MKTKVCGLPACRICPQTRLIASVALEIGVHMDDMGRTDREIRNVVEAVALVLCAGCTEDDLCDATVSHDEDGVAIEIDMYPRGSVPTALYA